MEDEEIVIPELGLLECNIYGMSRGWMRVSLQRSGGNLLVKVWPQPFAIEKTPEAQVHTATFPFDEAGRTDAAKWLSEEYTLFPDVPCKSPIAKPPADWHMPPQAEIDGE